MSASCECCVLESRKVEVPAADRSLVPSSPIKCGVSECDFGTSTMRMPRPPRVVEPWKEKIPNSVGSS